MELHITEQVQKGPSGWISPLVVVPKSDGEVKVCLYLRSANEAIIRECHHPIITVEELLHDLNGSTMLSKVDLKLGFLQIRQLGKSAYKQVYNAPVAASVQAVVIWCHMGIRKSSR